MVRFRRRGESQTSGVEKLINAVVNARGDESLSGFVIAADRGYRKMRMMPGLSRRGIGFIFTMPEHLLRCHPFVGVSQFDPTKGDIEQSDLENGIQQTPPADIRFIYDRENASIIDNSL